MVLKMRIYRKNPFCSESCRGADSNQFLVVTDIETIAPSVVLSSFTSGALVWLARNWISERLKRSIQHEYDQKLETHKVQLKHEHEKNIEQFKAQLQIAATERNIRLSRTFERTAEVVATTYAKLVSLQNAVEGYTRALEPTDDPQRSKLGRNVQARSEDFLSYYLPHKIYLPKDTAESVRQFSNTLHDLASRFSMVLAARQAQVTDSQSVDSLLKKLEALNEAVPKLLALLEEDFRRILSLDERNSVLEATAPTVKHK
jgi:hypothetical protein